MYIIYYIIYIHTHINNWNALFAGTIWSAIGVTLARFEKVHEILCNTHVYRKALTQPQIELFLSLLYLVYLL